MNIATIIILLLIVTGVFLALKNVCKHKKGGCEGCSRDCCNRIK